MIGIIIPTEQESKYITRKDGYKYIVSGAGKINATIAAMKLIFFEKVHAILCLGSCGSVDNTSIGSIVYPSEYVQSDMDLSALGLSYGMNLEDEKDYIYTLRIEDITAQMEEITYIHSRIATADKIIKDKKDSIFIYKYFNADFVDMESYAIAKVCFNYNIPFSTIRAVTDNENNQGDWLTNLELAMNNLNKVIEQIL